MRIGNWKLFETTIVGPLDNPLIVRYQLFRCPLFGIWIHKMCRSDHDRAMHDHPFAFISIILKGGYSEIHYVKTTENIGRYDTIEESELLIHKPGAILYRPALWRHRAILDSGKASWNLILVGKRTRKWGFWPDGKFCWWRSYDSNKGICEEGRILHTDNND